MWPQTDIKTWYEIQIICLSDKKMISYINSIQSNINIQWHYYMCRALSSVRLWQARNVTHTPKNRCYFQNTETENALEDHTD
jgi:hypothetical protein